MKAVPSLLNFPFTPRWRLHTALNVCFTCCSIVFMIFILLAVETRFHIRQYNLITKMTTFVQSGSLNFGEYPKRKAMAECASLFGRILVLIVVRNESMRTHYKVAHDSIRCYLKSTKYNLKVVDIDEDPRGQKCPHKQMFFKRHCIASEYLKETDWLLMLDADTGVVNPNHCIEEWINPTVDVLLYERFFNYEIAAGNYLAKNSPFAAEFLRKWADWEFKQPSNWNGADNGALQIHVLQTVLPQAKQAIRNCDKIWHEAYDYFSYMRFVMCVKTYLGATRIWQGKLGIYPKAHAWVRDGFLTADTWCETDFMFHGWKVQEVNKHWDSPFTEPFNVSLCGSNLNGWKWKEQKKNDVPSIRNQLAAFERSNAKSVEDGLDKIRNDTGTLSLLPFIAEPDIGNCYPTCPF